jgi:RNA polymerase sigma factor (TIGR02999 family)
MSGRDSFTMELAAYRAGDPTAFNRLVELVYPELRRVARRQLRRGRPDQPVLDTTGLVHEAYVKLVGQARVPAADRHHFLAIAARAMRQIVVEHARARRSLKRGSGAPHQSLNDDDVPSAAAEIDHVLAVNVALDKLAAIDDRLVQVVECRFFAGYSDVETADALAVSTRTVERDWLRAKAWLRQTMNGEAPAEA